MNQLARPVVGIDLGTTNSVIAYRDADGRPVTLLNAEGELTTPSVVYFHPSTIVVGKEAAKVALHEPERVVQYAKRDVGRSECHRTICGHRVPPEVVQALVLKKLKEDAQVTLEDVRSAVITVPAYFNEPRRKATQDAGRLAGLEVLDIINEPTAAAIAFGVQRGFLTDQGIARQRELILVYDLGGGTFDATLMELDGRSFRAVATAGDVHLGGIDWNRRVVAHLATIFQEEHSVDLTHDPLAMQTLMVEAEDAKRALTTRDDVAVHLAFDGRRSHILFSRRDFEALTEDLLQRTHFTVQRLLRDAKVSWSEISRLLLVGGSTRMPMIAGMLTAESGMSVDRSLSPDEAVAHGAAVYADLLVRSSSAERPELQVTNVNSHDLGVLGIESKTRRSRKQVLIARNRPLPATGVGRFITGREDQSSVAVNVIEGGDASGRHATLIGKCVVRQLPAGLPAKTPIEVRFQYAANGRLTVEAFLPTVKRQASLTIERVAGMSDRLLEKWEERIRDGLFLQDSEPQGDRDERSGPPSHVDGERDERDQPLQDWAESWPEEIEDFEQLAEPEDMEAVLDDAASQFTENNESPPMASREPPAAGNKDDDLNDFLRQFK